MIKAVDKILLQLGLVLTAGLSLGYGLSGLRAGNLAFVFLLLVMATVGEWLEVRLGHLAAFTLRPAIAFVGLWNGGPATMMLAGLLPLIFMRAFRRSTDGRLALAGVGREALGLWAGVIIYAGLGGPLLLDSSDIGRQLGAELASFTAFWCVQTPLLALDLHASEGIRYSTGIRELTRLAYSHVVLLGVAALSLSYIMRTLGFWVGGLAAIVLIETYYPLKLLGEQTGVLLTSVQMMAQAVDLKDPYTSNHSQRVSRYAVRIARALDLEEAEVERIRIGGLMHDIGKIGISGRIIRKPGKLTDEERTLMKKHSTISAEIIQHLTILGDSTRMVRHHHEHCDGSGYPDGLTRERIPIGSRIILVCDAYDALTTDRPYRKGASKEDALAVIRSNAGTQFDREVFEALERIADAL